MAEEANDDEGDNAMSNSKPSVFDRLQPSTSQQFPSVLNRMGKDETLKSFMFCRLRNTNNLNHPSSPELRLVKGHQVYRPHKKGI